MTLTYGAVLLFCAACQLCNGETTSFAVSHVFKYKVADHYANLLTRMELCMKQKIEEMGKSMKKHCPFSKVAGEYRATIQQVTSSGLRKKCPISEDRDNLKAFEEGYQVSRQECLAKADCKNELSETTTKIVNTIQQFDEQAVKDSAACKEDEACKKQVQSALLERLSKLYVDSYPTLRVVSDQSIANTKCYSTMVQCMIDKNTDRMKTVYTRMAKLQECMFTSMTSRPTWY